MLFGSACHVIWPLDAPPTQTQWDCAVTQLGCIYKKKTAKLPPSLICQPEAYLEPGDPVYCGTKLAKLEDAGPCNTFKTSTVIKLPFSDRLDTSPDYLKIKMIEDVEGFYLAYDTRVTHKPDWLENLFDKSTCVPDFITVTNGKTVNPPSPACNEPLIMEVYKWKTSPLTKDTVMTVPGNAHGYKNLPSNLPLACLRMYIPFVKPKHDPSDLDCSKPSDTETFNDKYCVSVVEEGKDAEQIRKEREEAATQLAKQGCAKDLKDRQLDNWSCDQATVNCEFIGEYCSTAQTLTVAHTVSSVVEFVPLLSTATFTLDGDSDTSQINGTIHFSYVFNKQLCDCMEKMLIQDMHLKIGNLSVKGQNFTDMYVSLNKKGWAECDNIASQIGRVPCQGYVIPQNELSFNYNVKHNGDQRLIIVDNSKGPAKVTVNDAAHYLEVKNITLVTKVEVNGDEKDLYIKFDLHGNFKNYAPHASGGESMVVSECRGVDLWPGYNEQQIHLTASQSFDINNPLPLQYEWYEDYGLPTQQLLGTGLNHYIQPFTMRFGVHRITLVVKDNLGIAGRDTFDVTVKDTIAPTITAPKPVYGMSLDGRGLKLYLGKPEVSDFCQGQDLWVSNDAPEVFLPGGHTVTWTADDGSGNISQAVQYVYVHEPVPLTLEGLNIGGSLPPGGLAPGPSPASYTITAGGADIWGTEDQFYYAYAWNSGATQPHYASGDFTAIVRVETMEPYETAHEWAKAGIMLRAGFEPESPHAMVIRSLRMGVALQGRDLTDQESWNVSLGGGYGQGDAVWLRLDRLDDVLTASYSVGGDDAVPATWMGSTSRETLLPPEVLIGLATTSHEQGVPITVEYSYFCLCPYAGPIVLRDPELPDSPSGGPGYMGIREVIDNGEINDQAACYASFGSGGGTIVDYTAPVLNIQDGGSNGNYGDDDVFGVVAGGHRGHGDVDHISLIARGAIRIPDGQDGSWTFGVNSDDGFTLQFLGQNFLIGENGRIVDFESGAALQFYGGRAAADTLGVINLPSGDHPFWLTYHEGHSAAAVEFFAAKGNHTAFVPDPGLVSLSLLAAPQSAAGSDSGVLKIDFTQNGGAVEAGFEVYSADHEQAATFASQSYSAFGTTVTLTPSWAAGAAPQAMQMIDRSASGRNGYTGDHANLLNDWIGTDNRQSGDPMTLTIGGLPAGAYSWLSYHHDCDDQTGIFDVTVNDATGSATITDIDISHSERVLAGWVDGFENVTVLATTIVSNGVDDITLVFDQTSGTDPVSVAFFVMNGLILQAHSPFHLVGGPDGLQLVAHPVAYWKLDEGGGIIAHDSSGYAHDATLKGDPCWVAADIYLKGIYNSAALQFDGIDDYVDCGTFNPSAATGEIAVAVWARWNGSTGQWQGIIGKRNTWAAHDMMWQIECDRTTGVVRAQREGIADIQDPSFVLKIGEWEHVAFTFDGSVGRLYRNGAAVASGPYSFGGDPDAAVVLGACQANGGNPFNGALDDVRVYDIALSPAEIAGLVGTVACLPACHPDYAEWVAVGKPACWCYPTQCHGDTDGLTGGSPKTGVYYVGPADLNVVVPVWLLKEPPYGPGVASVPGGICADFAHDVGGSHKTGVYRVGPTDLNILVANWLKKEPPFGPGVPPDCLDCP
jgi:hypothetical protein